VGVNAGIAPIARVSPCQPLAGEGEDERGERLPPANVRQVKKTILVWNFRRMKNR
jgi:hypothetical protein